MNRQYIGARYVPKFYENSEGTSEWMPNTQYEPLTIVTRNGNSYTSKKMIPASVGAPENNPSFWVSTGIYNQQLEEIREEVNNIKKQVPNIVNVAEFGCVGDGITDNYGILSALFSNPDYNTKTFYFPNGTYLVDGQLTISTAMTILGDNKAKILKGSNTGYVFYINFIGSDFYEWSTPAGIFDITIDCDNKGGAIALDDFVDYNISNVIIKNVSTYGINTRLNEGSIGVQLNVNDVKFYNTVDNTATAIYDHGTDNTFTHLDIVNFLVGIDSASCMASTVHGWLSGSHQDTMFADSYLVRCTGGMYTDMVCDTLGHGFYCGNGAFSEVYISGLRVVNTVSTLGNTTIFNLNNDNSTIISCKGLQVHTPHYKLCDVANPYNVELDNPFFRNPPAEGVNFKGGLCMSNAPFSPMETSVNSMTRSGMYVIDSAHPLSDLPSDSSGTGLLQVIATFRNQGGKQIFFDDNGTIYFRSYWNGSGTWYKFNHS